MATVNDERLRLDHSLNRLCAAAERQIHTRRARFSALSAGLDAMSPLKVLARGYTVTQRDGALLSSVKQVDLLDRIEVRFHDGSAVCTVNEIKE
jgi:exodeoxyribonuclease VII large subunit